MFSYSQCWSVTNTMYMKSSFMCFQQLKAQSTIGQWFLMRIGNSLETMPTNHFLHRTHFSHVFSVIHLSDLQVIVSFIIACISGKRTRNVCNAFLFHNQTRLLKAVGSAEKEKENPVVCFQTLRH